MPSKLPRPDTLMLIDDSRFDRLIVSRTIEYAKLFNHILVFSGGQEALDYINNNIHNKDKLPQFILVDIQMPQMNGFEFIENFSRLFTSYLNNCRVAMLSSTDDLSDIQKVKENSIIIKLLKKPLLPADLQHLLNEHFEKE